MSQKGNEKNLSLIIICLFAMETENLSMRMFGIGRVIQAFDGPDFDGPDSDMEPY